MTWDRVFELVRDAGHEVAPGLTAAELARAEAHAGAAFPPDYAALLADGLPLGGRFPDWRALDAALDVQLAWPVEGLAFDVENNACWLTAWGPRPAALEDALAVVAAAVAAAPRLIPVYGHRYLPAEPALAGNPVLSVHQSDIIVYGTDLATYFHNELAGGEWAPPARAVRPIRFWSDLL